MHQYHLKKFQSKDNTSVRSYKINFSSSASMLKVRSRTSLISFCNHAKYKKMLVIDMQIIFFLFLRMLIGWTQNYKLHLPQAAISNF